MMDTGFFGLRRNPFTVNPDPGFLYATPQVEDAIACLTYAIRNRKGFVMLTGEVGTGKTMLLNRLLSLLDAQHTPTCFLFNSQLDRTELLDFVLADFGVSCASSLKSQMLLHFNRWLMDLFAVGQTAVLVIDEAQNLSVEVLEEVRLLTNLETATDKLLQIVLCGQVELEDRLRSPELRQLRQRITLQARTEPMSLDQVGQYIEHRLRVAGADTARLFTPEAVAAIHRFCAGIPRLINVVCEHALIAVFATRGDQVDAAMVEEVARELGLGSFHPFSPVSVQAQPRKAPLSMARDHARRQA